MEGMSSGVRFSDWYRVIKTLPLETGGQVHTHTHTVDHTLHALSNTSAASMDAAIRSCGANVGGALGCRRTDEKPERRNKMGRLSCRNTMNYIGVEKSISPLFLETL